MSRALIHWQSVCGAGAQAQTKPLVVGTGSGQCLKIRLVEKNPD
jgi:hypothetical protein